jgi:RES domain-containing protein
MLTIFRLQPEREQPPHYIFLEENCLDGGRWNPDGVPVLYASSTIELALLELLVHFDCHPEEAKPIELFTLALDEDDVQEVHPASLPDGWNDPQPPAALHDIARRWIEENRSVALRVPSAVVAHTFNYLLNPRHDRIGQVQILKVEPFVLDPRLIARNETERV